MSFVLFSNKREYIDDKSLDELSLSGQRVTKKDQQTTIITKKT